MSSSIADATSISSAQAELTEPYRGLREDLRRGAYANYAAELLDRFTADEDINQAELFELLHQTLQRIAEADDPPLGDALL